MLELFWSTYIQHDKKNVLIYDMGDGILDMSILTVGSGQVEMKATDGDTHLGGDYLGKCMSSIEKCFKDSTIDKSSVHEVILVVGSTEIPKIREMIQEFFNRNTPLMNMYRRKLWLAARP